MVELRWKTPEGTTTKLPTLQWRNRAPDPWGRWTLWTDWQDAPTVVMPREAAATARTECAANGNSGCIYGPHGPGKSEQCEWCGEPPNVL